MPDETIPATPATPEGQGQQPAPATTPVSAAAPEAAPVADQTPAWVQELEKADPKAVRSHPRIAGIIGSEIQRAVEAERKRTQADEGTKAAREAEERLRELARSDPVGFTERWLTDDQKKKIQTDLDDLRGKTRAEIATNIGRGYQALPEWAELTPEDHERVAAKLADKPDDEAVVTYNQVMLDILAERRARKLHADWKAKELPSEREAIRTEEAAKLLQQGQAPDLAKPKGPPAKVDVDAMPREEFDRYWESLRHGK